MSVDPVEAIAQQLTQPKRARTDAGEVENHDIDQALQAARWVLQQQRAAAAGSPFAALRRAVVESPGASH